MLVRTRSLLAAFLVLPLAVAAQQKAGFASLQEALRAGSALSGGFGPRNVNWIDGGRRYSYMPGPTAAEKRFACTAPRRGRTPAVPRPGSHVSRRRPRRFAYQSFQWARDSKHLVFQTRFRPLYRRSGTPTTSSITSPTIP